MGGSQPSKNHGHLHTQVIKPALLSCCAVCCAMCVGMGAGSPYEVRFLRDQQAVADGSDVTSVYYDNPGGRVRVAGWAGRLGGW